MNPTICMGNLQRTNTYAGSGVRTLHGLRWQYTAKDALFFTPLLARDTLFFMDRRATVYALNSQKGIERWKVSPEWEDDDLYFGDPFRSGALTNDTLYIPWEVSPETALCGLSLQDGHIVNRYENDAIEAGLSFSSIAGDLLVGVNGETLCAFDLHHQHLKWTVEGFFSNTPPAFDEHLQRIYVSDMFEGNHHHGGLHAFDLLTGEKIWSVGQESLEMMMSPIPPLFLEGRVYMSAQDILEDGGRDVICAFDAETGQKNWQYSEQEMVLYSELAASRGTLYYARRDLEETHREICALDIQSQQLLWTAPVTASLCCAPALAAGVLYAATVEGTLYAFDLATGTPLWTFETHQARDSPADFHMPGSPWCIAENMVFYRTADTIYALY